MDTVYLTVKWSQLPHYTHYIPVHTPVSIPTTLYTPDISSAIFWNCPSITWFRLGIIWLQIGSVVQFHSTVPSNSNCHIPVNNSKFRRFMLQCTSHKWPNSVLLMNSDVPMSRLVTLSSILRLIQAGVEEFGHIALQSDCDQAVMQCWRAAKYIKSRRFESGFYLSG
jgi:hypothetical protein